MKRLVLAAAEAEDSSVGSIPRFNNMKVAVKTGAAAAAGGGGRGGRGGRGGDGLTVGRSSCWGKPRQLERRETSVR